MYRVGCLDYPRDDDRQFETEVDALGHAIVLSYNDSVIAVWDTTTEEDDVDGEIVLLVYQQTAYHP